MVFIDNTRLPSTFDCGTPPDWDWESLVIGCTIGVGYTIHCVS